MFQEVYDDRLLGLTIRDGTDDTGMVSLCEEGFSDQDFFDVIAYIRSFALR